MRIKLVITIALALAACADRRKQATRNTPVDVTGYACNAAAIPYGLGANDYCNKRAYCVDTGSGFDCSGVAPSTLDFYRCEVSTELCAPCYCLSDSDCQYVGQSNVVSTCIDPGDCKHVVLLPPDAGVDAPIADAGGGGGGSCAGACGGQAPSGCWCDATCASYGDCCFDRANVCGYPDAGTDAPTDAPSDAPTDAPPGDAPTDAPGDANDGGPDGPPSDAPGEGGPGDGGLPQLDATTTN
jgi:hypothetical protein